MDLIQALRKTHIHLETTSLPDQDANPHISPPQETPLPLGFFRTPHREPSLDNDDPTQKPTCQRDGLRVREAQQPSLGRRIALRVRLALQSARARHVDNARLAGRHVRQRVRGDIECADQVRVDEAHKVVDDVTALREVGVGAAWWMKVDVCVSS